MIQIAVNAFVSYSGIAFVSYFLSEIPFNYRFRYLFAGFLSFDN